MKKCKIYYATVVRSEGSWARVGEKVPEPVRVEGRSPLGKVPEFCCEAMRLACDSPTLYIEGEHITIREFDSHAVSNINFCPFCGAKIVFIPNLRLQAVKYSRPTDSYYFSESE